MKNQPLKIVNPSQSIFHMWTGRAAFILHQLFSHLGYNFLQTRVSLCSSKNTSFAFKFTSRLSHSLSSPLTWLWITASPLTVTAACDGYDDSIQDKQVDTYSLLFP